MHFNYTCILNTTTCYYCFVVNSHLYLYSYLPLFCSSFLPAFLSFHVGSFSSCLYNLFIYFNTGLLTRKKNALFFGCLYVGRIFSLYIDQHFMISFYFFLASLVSVENLIVIVVAPLKVIWYFKIWMCLWLILYLCHLAVLLWHD